MQLQPYKVAGNSPTYDKHEFKFADMFLQDRFQRLCTTPMIEMMGHNSAIGAPLSCGKPQARPTGPVDLCSSLQPWSRPSVLETDMVQQHLTLYDCP